MPKVLLVEDDKLMADLYEAILTSHNYDVENVANGKIALEKASSWHPDLIVLDLMMPAMSGLEVLKYLKAEKKTEKIPVIVFSNLLDEKAADQCMEAGAARFALKSDYQPHAFVEMVKEVLAA
jgi:two-component system sensor histidine kinase/response regulator